eukprot:1161835-Pelagomonas_calceolata.AAC.1
MLGHWGGCRMSETKRLQRQIRESTEKRDQSTKGLQTLPQRQGRSSGLTESSLQGQGDPMDSLKSLDSKAHRQRWTKEGRLEAQSQHFRRRLNYITMSAYKGSWAETLRPVTRPGQKTLNSLTHSKGKGYIAVPAYEGSLAET